jgi:ATP/maltotriose-dependent transcriptional regulator MalT
VLGAALADNNRAEILTIQWHLDDAEALLRRAQRVMRAASYPLGATGTISGLARIAAWRGQLDEALDLQTTALAGFQELHADDQIADALVRLAEIHVLRGEPDTALVVLRDADVVLARLPDVTVLPATQLRWRARALLASGDIDAARSAFARALDKARADGSEYEMALATIGLARIDTDPKGLGDADAALARLGVLAPPPGS